MNDNQLVYRNKYILIPLKINVNNLLFTNLDGYDYPLKYFSNFVEHVLKLSEFSELQRIYLKHSETFGVVAIKKVFLGVTFLF